MSLIICKATNLEYIKSCRDGENLTMMTLREYLRGQLTEARSSENKWYCSQYYGYEITDPQVLMEYYIKHGGTQHFAKEHRQELDASRA
jgi:hypothetical protein